MTTTKINVKGVSIPFAQQLAQELAEQTGETVAAWLESLATSPSISITQPDNQSIWISEVNGTWLLWNGTVMSACYHESLDHTATTFGKLGEKKSRASAGHWAVSIQTKGMFKNKAFYSLNG